MLIVIYEYVYSIFIYKFGEDNCANTSSFPLKETEKYVLLC